jgi:prepilin-type processing-associated H-X9-DG protein
MNFTVNRPAKQGFSLASLLVIIAVLAVLAAMLLPALASAKKKASSINCVNNLKQSCLAFRIWEGDNGDKYPMAVSTSTGGTMEYADGADTFRHFQVMSNELSTPKILICPQDTRLAAKNFVPLNNQNVSYFVDLDGNEEYPQMLLTGDRNLTADNEPANGILKLVPGQRVSWTQTVHVNQGNIGFTDGSVQQLSNSALNHALQNSGDPTNTWRISLPE